LRITPHAVLPEGNAIQWLPNQEDDDDLHLQIPIFVKGIAGKDQTS